MSAVKSIAVLATAATLVAAPQAAAAKPITKAQAVKTARVSASEYLTMAGIPFGVEPADWRVRCRRRGRWVCRVRQGPCSGRLKIVRVSLGGQLRGVGRVGCIAD